MYTIGIIHSSEVSMTYRELMYLWEFEILLMAKGKGQRAKGKGQRAMSKYRDYFNEMFALHREQFQAFMLLCQDYMKDRASYSEEFNRQGKEVKDIISEWDRRLCAKMERGRNGVYSSNVSEKFWDEVRKYFPCIDEVGVKVSRIRD